MLINLGAAQSGHPDAAEACKTASIQDVIELQCSL